MTKQFIAHAEAPKTFAHKKGAVAAIKRDLDKHFNAYGDVLYDTGYDVKPAGDSDRFGVVLFVDLTPSQAQELVGPELSGYVIEPQLKEENTKVKSAKTDDEGARDDKPARSRGRVEIEPSGLPLVPARYGSKQQLIIEMLDKGATIQELVDSLERRDGAQWKPESLMAGLYHHFPHKGYGIRTTQDDDGTYRYWLRYPQGVETFAAPRRPQSQQNRLDRIRDFLVAHDTRQSHEVNKLTDDQILDKFKNMTAAKAYVAKMESGAI